ncbi:sodium-dependent transporter [Slackia exigua]|uniref:sodium-dependent transporter n=1 Tax=Slackia exigua TaxID=84109 RepID=UPI0023F2CF99|nr:sodium-dependent transporter [Slackia exigua]
MTRRRVGNVDGTQREQFGSRLGFILISAGCAIGLGNVWRFPYITGQYGGAAFVVMYVLFLIMLSLPIMAMEFAVGRASQKSTARSFDALEPAGSAWHRFKWVSIVGFYLLMMFYSTVAGWMVAYIFKSGSGAFAGQSAEAVGDVFNAMLANPVELVFWTLVVVAIGVACTAGGLRGGVERVTKVMMVALLVVLAVLCVRAVTLPGAEAGLEFYLVPDFGKLFSGDTAPERFSTFIQAAYAALGQAFFTLSVGLGSMSIFGSYIGKDRSLFGEALRIGGLDTAVALVAGLIIFPACFAFGVTPDSGPGLVFVTLPGVFNQMWGGQLWGTLFFLFMSFAALSSVIAVFENIMGFSIDQWGFSRRRAVIVNGIALFVLSVPCILGFNLWSGFEVPGIGNVQSLEDFLLSNNILLVGALVFLLFCVSKRGWGWESFIAEADTGEGARFPKAAYAYMKFVVPALIVVVFVAGWIPVLATWTG